MVPLVDNGSNKIVLVEGVYAIFSLIQRVKID